MFDNHIHTKFSADSTMHIDEVLKKIKDTSIGATITEHMDYNFPYGDKFTFDPVKYFEEYSKFRGNSLLLGVEVGIQLNCVEENYKLQRDCPFDYVIGSIHLISGEDIYDSSIYDRMSKKDVYSMYFKDMIDCLKEHRFIDSLGHIDYIARYARYDDSGLYYSEFSDEIDEVLRFIIENEIILEINTKKFEDKTAIDNITPIIKRYRELGAKYVTLGSDAHTKENIGLGFNTALSIAEENKLKPVYFKERKMQYI